MTNDKKLNKFLLDPVNEHEREYWVQVEGMIDDTAIKNLQEGVTISSNGKKYQTKKCKVQKIFPSHLEERQPPIRVRKSIPDSWIKMILTEGKNRQVRKMTAHVGFPTLRLIRYRIEKITLDNLKSGQMRMLTQSELYNLLENKR